MNVDFFSAGKSVLFLQKKCRKLLSEKGLDLEILFEENFHWKKNTKSKPRDVLLLGDALLLLTNSYLWPKTGNFRFWVLSEAHKALISEMMKIDKRCISVIPRALIVKPKKVMSSWPDFSRPANLVISSRFEQDKNLHFTLHLANVLQGLYPSLRIAFFSPSKIKKEFKELVDAYHWKRRPRFFGDKGFNWHKSISLSQPFLVNFSTYPMEDFSVSAAQAQELGWPLILSSWAVFKEIKGESIIKISSKDIFKYNQSKNPSAQEEIIKSVIQNALFKSDKKATLRKSEHDLIVPKSMSARKLSDLQVLWTLEKRNKLIEAIMEPKKRNGNHVYREMRELLS